jgi:hypothetical protein
MNELVQSLKRLRYFVVNEYDRLFAGLYLVATMVFLYIFLQ